MRLSSKLARLGTAGPGSQAAAAAPSPAVLEPMICHADARERVRRSRIDHLRSLIGEMEARANARAEAEAAARQSALRDAPPLPGDQRQTAHGTIRISEHDLEPEHCHGAVPVADALGAGTEALSRLALDPSLAGLDLSGALFLDTETTGLSGGTGTIPFLIGYSRFVDRSLRVTQLLLEEPGREGPMLEELKEAVEACTVLVTYNGKSYDWPLLSTRFVMNRVRPPSPRPHLDLLHVARRVFRLRLGSARLVTMEEQILSMRRERDIDGAEIPGVYWSFLRHRDPTQMATVMEHNANDLVALPALMSVVAGRYARLHVHDDPRDHLSLARIAVRARDHDRGALFARAALEGGGEPETTVQAGLLLAELLRKIPDVAGAVRALEDAVEAADSQASLAAPAHLALAKLHEHRTKDLRRALVHAAFTGEVEGPEGCEHRRARLERRIERQALEACRPRRPRKSGAALELVEHDLAAEG